MFSFMQADLDRKCDSLSFLIRAGGFRNETLMILTDGFNIISTMFFYTV